MSLLGLDAKLYYNSGTVAVPAWNEVQGVRDLTLNQDKALADSSSRRNAGWRTQRGTLKQGSVDFAYVYEPGDADFDKLMGDFMNNISTQWAIYTGDIATPGNEGLVAYMDVTAMNKNEPLEEVQTFDITLTVSEGDASDPAAPGWQKTT